ncbi:MAG: MBL fold metallo-hydrolase [Nocardioidaceae bacterium]
MTGPGDLAGPSWRGGRFGERGRCVLAPNAGTMTLDGTNTWVLRETGAARAVVIDPGPPDPAHLDRVAAYAGQVAVVLLTHGHLDHAEAARSFAERMGCGVRALDPAQRLGSEGLGDGDVVAVDGLELHVVATPGHTSDSLSFVVPAERAVLTGDTVLGRGTTVVAHPDGQLGAYLGSLHRLRALTDQQDLTAVWPGHGPVLDDAAAVLERYLEHRRDRLEQVREALHALTEQPQGQQATVPGEGLARRVVERVYADVDERLWGAAELSVRAQIDYLRRPPR